MQMKEVCRRCGLTKKAVEYYEARGLIAPSVRENGYRDYSQEDLRTLKEIAVLRQCGVGVPEIGEILAAEDPRAALEKWKTLADLRAKRMENIRACVDGLIQTYDVEGAFRLLQEREEDLLTVRERMILAFPGNYGLLLSLHFGRFLEGRVDTEEKRRAYDALIGYLDRVELHMTPELSDFLEETFRSFNGRMRVGDLERQTQERLGELLEDPEGYVEQNREELEEYIAFRASEAFQNSPAGRLGQLLLEFQQRSGYQEIFWRT